jgi:hypothetical protein
MKARKRHRRLLGRGLLLGKTVCHEMIKVCIIMSSIRMETGEYTELKVFRKGNL